MRSDPDRLPTSAARRAPDRPWLFGCLIAPDAVISLGLVSGALTFLLRNEGVDPARAAGISALISLPHAIYFLWGPMTDFWFQRRTWVVIAAAASAVALFAAFHLSRLGSTAGVALLLVAASLAVLVPAACGGMMAALHSERHRRLASSAYQTGSLVIGAAAVFTITDFSGSLSAAAIGAIVAAILFLPSLAAFAAPSQAVVSEHTPRQTLLLILRECKATFWRWEAIPYILIVAGPQGSGALIGLLPELARDYSVSSTQVAWINGAGGALLTAAGAIAASLIPARIPVPVSCLICCLLNAAATAILALAPTVPAVYLTGTVCFLFTVGASYALVTAVILEFLGRSGKSGSGRYSLVNSLANVPVFYMTLLDGFGYSHGGPRGMPGIDALVSASAAFLLLAYFLFCRKAGLSVPAEV